MIKSSRRAKKPDRASSIGEQPEADALASPVLREDVPAATDVTTTAKGPHHMDKTFKTAEDFIAFGQGNVEAFVRASQIWATGVQDLSKQIAASTQAQVEESFDTVKALSAVKSLKEAVDLHSSLSKTAVEKTLAESTRFADAAAKLAEQAFAPITERMAIATEAFARPIV